MSGETTWREDFERAQRQLAHAERVVRVSRARIEEHERVRYFVVLLTASAGLVSGACIGAVSMAWWGASGAAFAVGSILLLGHVVLHIAARKAGGRKST